MFDAPVEARATTPRQRRSTLRAGQMPVVADVESHKMDELSSDPGINLSYFDNGSREWVSVSGTARISTDRREIRRVYQPDWKAWFGKIDEIRDGGPDDPRLALILVEAETVIYMKVDKPKPVVLFELVKGMVTGQKLEIGDTHRLNLESTPGARS
ncbi:MAG TPA: pyridoxamine 5'-phosphate oxidase family protein [Gemmatimonadaceae bacterium]|nr:pyridoxamine 5'-phosphate oxidase family protein [Gemmatimonadaceae bacterium]